MTHSPTTRLNPHLNFKEGQARAAMEFYASVLGGDLTISTFGDMGAPAHLAEQVMHAQLETPTGFTLMGADAPPEMTNVTFGDNISVSISGPQADADAMRTWFAGLAEGGTVTQPLIEAPWGDEFGMLLDRFGINWMVNIVAPGS
jgi:PhnB protein